ncbi:DNA polymerase III subunit delta' [Candidatus Brocadia sapporoensis]|uniref:DNA polymerase III subunit delta n=1 Tax=Candidatus Brocadia sapporoensis TaxID=392547 RepID=A0A1V6LXG7_9BACT|nr:DNA polymerase III subunit delta' [Candidatus Brocadia sapporoensis]MDG6005972.1 DNA polymerase III subunit delta' [Candidatus Brocadia sp.]OQD44834.1 DNA polymerase III subunit delta' [Candidatus Brocadia sapporoensis]GJQ22997.1 MAG: DNA polymerase III subunit delta' [Candidatus Brocadia sapporoensis]
MSFKNIFCQDRIVNLFQKAIVHDHLAHAYIFAGQEGIGKTLFSKELAKTIFCQHARADACDTCSHCQRITNDNFPDLFFVLPEKNSRTIKIEQLRHLQDVLHVKPLESKYKIAIIQSADKMNEESSNCLLKTLEEPPSHAIIILIVTSLESVRETVRSRCQIIRFFPLSMIVVKDILVNSFHLDEKQAEQLACISNGSIERAALLSSTHALDKKNWLVDRILTLGMNDNLTFSKELLDKWNIQDLEILEEKRSQVKELILSFLLYYRDLLICKIQSGMPVYHTNWRNTLTSKCQVLSEEVLFRIIQVIKTSLEQLDHNANIALLLENMITKILRLQFGDRTV